MLLCVLIDGTLFRWPVVRAGCMALMVLFVAPMCLLLCCCVVLVLRCSVVVLLRRCVELAAVLLRAWCSVVCRLLLSCCLWWCVDAWLCGCDVAMRC